MDPQTTSGFRGNDLIKRAETVYSYSKEEVAEYIKCSKDPIYFIEKYVKVIHPSDGLIPFKLYPYQKEIVHAFQENRFNIVLACRQSGKSTIVCAFITWFGLFNAEKTIALLANKGMISREMLGRIVTMLENIPFFLQPGAKELNKGSIRLGNDTRIIAAATSSSSIRGLSISLLYADELGFVDRAEEFWASTYPVITAGKDSRVIITSTANGVGNLFYRLWQGAVNKTNDYFPSRVDWYSVPGRDEKWKETTIKNTSQAQFDQEYSNSFMNTGGTLIDANTLLGLVGEEPIEDTLGGNLKYYETAKEGHSYSIYVDTSHGRGGDYSTATVVDHSDLKCINQVAVFRDNRISPLFFPEILFRLCKNYNDAMIFVENNDIGFLVIKELYYEYEYENVFNESAMHATGLGIKMTKRSKKIGCSNLKDIIERGILKIHDKNTIVELSTFSQIGNSYGAIDGNNDDLVMNLVLLGYALSLDGILSDDHSLRNLLYAEKAKNLEDDLPFEGFFDDGGGFVDEVYEREVKDLLEFGRF